MKTATTLTGALAARSKQNIISDNDERDSDQRISKLNIAMNVFRNMEKEKPSKHTNGRGIVNMNKRRRIKQLIR